MIPSHPIPRSKSELLTRARHEARHAIGRPAFVRDARLLPIGVPLALGAAALVFAQTAPRARGLQRLRRVRPIGRERVIAAIATFVGAMVITYVGARAEWALLERERLRGI